jgi:hypothetical protein
MLVTAQFHEVARVVEGHYVVETIPPEIRNRLWAGRIPREVARRRLEEMIRSDPRLIHRIPGQKVDDKLYTKRCSEVGEWIRPRCHESSAFIKLTALSNPHLLDDESIQWTRRSLPIPEDVRLWEQIEGSQDSESSRERRRIIHEREVECARIAGDAIVAHPEWWR